ncbi:MAG: hypothetical protein PVG39_15325 [Desulfobacteraceae bacterium]
MNELNIHINDSEKPPHEIDYSVSAHSVENEAKGISEGTLTPEIDETAIEAAQKRANEAVEKAGNNMKNGGRKPPTPPDIGQHLGELSVRLYEMMGELEILIKAEAEFFGKLAEQEQPEQV